jgi:hypothetical protein
MGLITDEKIERFVTKALRFMFDLVGEEYSVNYCMQDGWQRKHTVDIAREQAFYDWLVVEIKKEFKWSQKKTYAEAEAFILNYGWMREEQDDSWISFAGQN